MTHFAAAFDKNYLARALTMRRSVAHYMPDSKFWFLCLDDESKAVIDGMDLPSVVSETLGSLNDQELMATKAGRTPTEFAMTAKPAWIASLMHSDRIAAGDMLVLIDADIMMYSDPKPLIKKLYSHSISITPHRFDPKEAELKNEKYGIYNSGLIFFVKDGNSLSCTADWRRQCIDWCSTKPEPGLYTDQRYLNDWTTKYAGVYAMPDKGVNVGSWDIYTHDVQCRMDANSFVEKAFTVDGEPLICYHFHALKIYFDGSGRLRALPVTVHNRYIYSVGLRELQKDYELLSSKNGRWEFGTVPRPSFLILAKQKLWKMF